MCIQTPQPLPEGPAEGGAVGEGLRGLYAHRRGLGDRTGPSKRPRPPIRRTTHLAAAELGMWGTLQANIRFNLVQILSSGPVFDPTHTSRTQEAMMLDKTTLLP